MGADAYRNLKHLRNLNLHDGRCTDEGLRELTKLTALRTLCLWCCHHITPDGVRAVVVPLSRHALGWVDVTGCRHLTPLGPQWVGQTQRLECTHALVHEMCIPEWLADISILAKPCKGKERTCSISLSEGSSLCCR